MLFGCVFGILDFKSQEIHVCRNGVCNLAKFSALGACSYLNSWWTALHACTHARMHACEYNASYFLLLYRTRRQNKRKNLAFTEEFSIVASCIGVTH